MIIGTQEVAEISRQVLGQTTHWLRFYLGNRYDSRLLDSKMRNERGEPTAEYGFLYNNRWLFKHGEVARMFSDVKYFLGGYL